MDRNYKLRKIAGDKIFLLGLFVASLLIARLVVASKSAILLSKPIYLSTVGLSVSMPEKNGWKAEKQWRPHENGFALRSSFTVDTNNPTAEVRCVYIAYAETTDPQRLFSQKAYDIEGEIKKTGQIKKDNLIFNWAYIENPKNSLIVVYGTAKLSQNSRLEIEIQQIRNDPQMAEKAFKKIVNNLDYEEPQLI
ncbi:MAG: hypothetical protein JW837_01890 [Sedimentisphaerales bacterium]|nr:hypothetical protein [Sedimentisphaerales bacterium]